MLLTIIVPVYNASSTLERCVNSILKQDFKDFELLLINDGSIDESGSLCDSFADMDGRVKVFHHPNGGPAKARNYGINQAHGDYIAFVDADDFIDSEIYNRLISFAENYNVDVVMCNYIAVSASMNSKTICRHGFNKDALVDHKLIIERYYGGNSIGIPNLWNKVYKKEFLNCNNLRIDENRVRAEDYWFNFELLKRKPRIFVSQMALYYYVQDTAFSLMKSYRCNQFDLFISTLKLLKENNEKEFGFKYKYKYLHTEFLNNTVELIHQMLTAHYGLSEFKKIIKSPTIAKVAYVDRNKLSMHIDLLYRISFLSPFIGFLGFKIWHFIAFRK